MSLCTLQIEYEHRELSFLCHACIQLTQRSCGTVAWICKQFQPEQLLPFVDLSECSAFHIDLSAHFKIWDRVVQCLYNIADCACIQSHILTLHNSVAACDGAYKHTVFIAQGKGQPIDLFFHNKLR